MPITSSDDPLHQPLPTVVTVGSDSAATEQRVEQSLDELQRLAKALELEEDYGMPDLEHPVPADFLLSIVVPVYNERDTIARVIGRLRALPLPTEIIVVDDHSTDGTSQRLKQISELTGIRAIFKPQNEGKGAALRTGFEHATGTVIAIQDADLEYDCRDLLSLIEPILRDEADVVYGSRFQRNGAIGSSWVHRCGNGMLTWLSNRFTGLKLTDMETCYKVFNRSLVGDLQLQQDRFGFEPEITAKLARSKARFRELPVRYEARDWEDGKKIGFRDGLNAVYCILRYAWCD